MSDGDPRPPTGNVIPIIPFSEVHRTEGFRDLGNEYAQAMSEHTIAACLRLELPIEFAPMFKQHLDDLHLIVFDETETHRPKSASLDVRKLPNGGEEGETSYKRVMLVSEQEIDRRTETLEEVFKKVSIGGVDKVKTQAVAIDWIFYEMAMASLSVACFMQQHFPNYIGDWNGTNKYDNAHRTVSENFLTLNPDMEIDTREDTKRLIKGFGIMMIHNALLTKGLVARGVHADWVVESIRHQFPEAYRSEEIAERLSAVKPSKDVKSQIALFALAIYDPNIVLDDTDITQ